MKKIIHSLAALIAVLLLATSAQALDVDLYAGQFTKVLPDGRTVTMWGYSLTNGDYTTPGPVITIPEGDSTLNVTLHNNLPVATSLIIPGLPSTNRSAVATFESDIRNPGDATQLLTGATKPGVRKAHSFEVPAQPAGMQIYSYTNVSPGTYCYHSATNPAAQYQMGLIGAMVKRFGAGQVYGQAETIDFERLLVMYSLHADVHDEIASGVYDAAVFGGTYGDVPGSTMESLVHRGLPTHRLMQAYDWDGTNYVPADTNQTYQPDPGVAQQGLFRLVNLSQNLRSAAVVGGNYMDVRGIDANELPFPPKRLSLEIAPQQTAEVLITHDAGDGAITAVYDRRLGLATGGSLARDGMIATLINGVPPTVQTVINYLLLLQ